MKQLSKILLVALFCCGILRTAVAQYPVDDKWYQNPLGFSPLNLHTSMGFIVPATITGAALLLTKRDTTLLNRCSVYSEMAATFGYKYPYTTIAQNNTGVNIHMRRWLSVGAEFSTTMPFDDYNQTMGLSIRPFARFYPINRPGWKLWFESGGGLIYFFDNFPKPTPEDERLGTYLNGTTKYGLGTSFQLRSGANFYFGIRHLHISNGDTKGVERNPSHDSNGLFAGLSWYLKSK